MCTQVKANGYLKSTFAKAALLSKVTLILCHPHEEDNYGNEIHLSIVCGCNVTRIALALESSLRRSLFEKNSLETSFIQNKN